MKVLNLQCSRQHSFEGWFASEEDFRAQLARSLIECPLCSDKHIHKLPSAPRLNLGVSQTEAEVRNGSPERTPAEMPSTASALTPPDTVQARGVAAVMDMPAGASLAEQAVFLRALRHLVARSEDVGERFSLEARRMHYGEIEPRSIRGQTTAREALELLDEGIDVMPLPELPGIKETLQ